MKGKVFLQKLGMNLMEKTGNPQPQSEEDEAAGYEKKRKAAEAKYNLMDTMDRMNNPPSVQEMRARERERAEKDRERVENERKEAESRTRELEERERQRLADERQEATRQAAEAQQQREELQHQLQEQRDKMLMEKLQELQASKKPLDQQVEEYFVFAEKAAEKMGFQKPGPRAADDPRIALEIAKLDLEKEREKREFEWKMEQDRRKWDLEMEKLRDEREYRHEQMKQQEKKDELFINAPRVFASVVAKGMLDGMSDQEGGGISSGSDGRKHYNLTINEDAEGEIKCPTCQSAVAIGPTTTKAVCVKCHSTFGLARQPRNEPDIPAQAGIQEEEEE